MSFKKVGDSKGPMGVESIYVDTKYRVEYLYVSGHKTAGITVLLDRDAKPTIYNGEEFDVN
ncbi:MAG: xylan 1,4-beta-xylosidase [Clostridia bacterium]|nr:xylan 1,4-beta-xylosidase [Clostridia bacterium]